MSLPCLGGNAMGIRSGERLTCRWTGQPLYLGTVFDVQYRAVDADDFDLGVGLTIFTTDLPAGIINANLAGTIDDWLTQGKHTAHILFGTTIQTGFVGFGGMLADKHPPDRDRDHGKDREDHELVFPTQVRGQQ